MISIWTLMLIANVISTMILATAIIVTEYNNYKNESWLNKLKYNNFFYLQSVATILVWIVLAMKHGIITA